MVAPNPKNQTPNHKKTSDFKNEKVYSIWAFIDFFGI
jgi:hypothetical protein